MPKSLAEEFADITNIECLDCYLVGDWCYENRELILRLLREHESNKHASERRARKALKETLSYNEPVILAAKAVVEAIDAHAAVLTDLPAYLKESSYDHHRDRD